MTPDRYGYRPCVRCGVQRPAAELISDDGEKTGVGLYVCADSALCSRLAGVVSDGEVLAAMGEPTPLESALEEVTR